MRDLIKTTLLISLTATTNASRLRGSDEHRQLNTPPTIVNGKCTMKNFSDAVGGRGKLAALLEVENAPSMIRQELGRRCKIALEPEM